MASSRRTRPLAGPEPASVVVDAANFRRGRLATAANPGHRHDYVISLAGELRLPGLAPSAIATLRYVPDALVLRPAAFSAYLAVLSAGPWETLEALATTMLDDVNNELVPRWCHVSVTATGDGGEHHAVDAEDRQPAWENAAVLARLPTI